jgi:3-oxoacyl-[acyl-carrier-protein] synthase-1
MAAPAITALTLVSAIGRGLDATEAALRNGRSGLSRCDFDGLSLNTYVGEVPLEDSSVVPELAVYDCRNSRLAQLALRTDGFEDQVQLALARYRPGRIGVVVGTTTSGIQEAEHAYAERAALGTQSNRAFQFEYSQSHFSVTDFVRRYLGIQGPAFTVSTACSSSSKAFVDAQQLLSTDLCDAVVVGGVDSLCWMSLCGFNSLQLLSTRPCRPADANRDGLSIGEAAGFALIERSEAAEGRVLVRLLGTGESCDAHHMSAPHPEGQGAALAMHGALMRAKVNPADVNYINLHGTGTPANDRAEDLGICTVFGTGKPCSSTKGYTGHTLGAAGIVEVVISAIALRGGFMPGNLNLETPDREIRSEIVRESQSSHLRCVLTNSFGFGGSNCSLVLAKI